MLHELDFFFVFFHTLWKYLQSRLTHFRKRHATRRQEDDYEPILEDKKLYSSVETLALAKRMPKGAWDSHMHVTLPEYPLVTNAAYTPHNHSLRQALQFESTIGISNIVLVQPSIYGNDNSCVLEALRVIGPRRGRAVVCFDPDTIEPETLRAWHKLGVRGVRVNLKSVNEKITAGQLEDRLRHYAAVIRPLKWVLELYMSMEAIPMLERIAGELGVRICIAHCGAPNLPPLEKRAYSSDPYELPGFRSLVNLLQNEDVWVKLSAAYRFDQDPELGGIEPVVRELLKKAPRKAVFASDWPHTRFEGLNIKPFVERCLQWTEQAGVTSQVFCRNAEELWNVQRWHEVIGVFGTHARSDYVNE